MSALRPDESFAAALDAWRAVLGAAGVIVSTDAVAAANCATFAASSFATAILLPSSRTQVARCLLIAAEFNIPVHPVSRGNNWGYGSRLPARGGSVLLSLAGLNRVLHFDEALATVTLEPGVSFAALAAHMADAGSRLLPPSTGSGPHTSVLGNVMERGLGKGLYEDMAAHAAGFDVVLPTGETVQTQAASGPGLHGLFVQSNLGVVVAMEFRLHPAPPHRQLVWARLLDGAVLARFVDAIRPLLQQDDPWIRPELVTDHRAGTQGSDTGAGGWLAAVWLWGRVRAGPRGPPRCSRFRVAVLRRDAAGGGRRRARVVLRVRLRGAAGRLFRQARRHAGAPRSGPRPLRRNLGGARAAHGGDAVVARTLDAAAAIMARHGFGPAISLRAMDGRTAKAVIGLFYDRDEPGADDRAATCNDALTALLRDAGLAPYRRSILDPAPAGSDGRMRLLLAIKQVTDPSGILAPGRYIG